MKENRKNYDRIFKEKADQLNNERQYFAARKGLGRNAPLLYKWFQEHKEFGTGSFSGIGNFKGSPEQEKIHQLEKKLKDAELEREHLKKNAIDIFFKGGRRFIFSKRNMKEFIRLKRCAKF